MLVFENTRDVLHQDHRVAARARGHLRRLDEAYGSSRSRNGDGGRVEVLQYLDDLSPELEGTLAAGAESVVLCAEHFDVLVLANNDYSVNYLVPDAAWLPPTLRAALVASLDPAQPLHVA
jgi:hypothetical protein